MVFPSTILSGAALLLAAAAPQPMLTPNDVVAAAPAADWATLPEGNVLVVELANGRRIAIALAADLAPVHVANIRVLARAGWWDGTSVNRVQDNYVAQWGDASEKKPLPAELTQPAPAEYDRPATGLAFTQVPYPDTFAATVGVSGAFPVAARGGRAWGAHCYGIVGAGRGLAPDTGSGAELYAVIGHAPRALDRNIAVVGRVLTGMDALASLPRGTGPLGFYAKPEQRVAIVRARLAMDLPPGERPTWQVLRPDSASYARWLKVRANRDDAFFRVPAVAVDLCNALPPVREVPR